MAIIEATFSQPVDTAQVECTKKTLYVLIDAFIGDSRVMRTMEFLAAIVLCELWNFWGCELVN